MRFLSGDTNPTPTEPPVLQVSLPSDPRVSATLAVLASLKDEEAWLYVYYSDGSPIQIETEYGQEHTLEPSPLSVQLQQYTSADYQRLAQRHYESSLEQLSQISNFRQRLARLRELLDNQQARLEVKIAGHAEGSTAHTLYEQQLSFIARVRSEAEA